ncbi:hypothetical protein L3V59_36190 [Burkholderia aenigmatica]|uniref:hypothetical protein n=1 Tax=Burkholderia aenigmatica TaxID=2015348 RepID=UPI001F3B953B|nr:hypothetical protein [Burkholderia aenigmatica]UKD17386.1 hypothetical protein L3V59_36190 [Burkholderia aenigmatica]
MNPEELTRKQALAKLVAELDQLYPLGSYDATALKDEKGMPDFVTARNGHERQFAQKAKLALRALAYAWTKEVPKLVIRVDAAAMDSLLRQTVADLHAEGLFGVDDSANLTLLNQTIQQTLENTRTDFTHSFPARTLGMEFESPIIVGPVTFMTRDQWINTVDFSEHAKNTSPGGQQENLEWKAALRHALSKPAAVQETEAPLPWLAAQMYGPLSASRSLLRVSLSGYERSLSKKAARQICKTALDGLSLMLRGTALGGNDLFHQQTLGDERMPPVAHHTLIESNGFLYLPGYGLNKQIGGIDARKAKAMVEQGGMLPKLDALAHILDALVSPESHLHPQLAMRWSMALDWLAEGEREASEAIALAKIGTSLDVLTEGGKFAGILNMLTHLTGWKEDSEFMVGANPRTLRWLVKELYDHGRSKILHGNVFDRLQSFAEMRIVGASLARIALIECAMRLKHYTGEDTSKALRTIPRAVTESDAVTSES